MRRINLTIIYTCQVDLTDSSLTFKININVIHPLGSCHNIMKAEWLHCWSCNPEVLDSSPVKFHAACSRDKSLSLQ